MNPVAYWQECGEMSVVRLAALESLGGVAAIFTGRTGGASPRWGGGLNWSCAVGDDPEAVQENRRRSLALLGLTPADAAIAGLVHGDRVVAVTGEEPVGRDGIRFVPDCDGLITDRPGLALVVTAADCVPVYLYDPVRRAVGLVHAGWRGTVAGIAGKAVRAMAERYGCRPADVRAAVGPSIGPCCFEVDEPVVRPLREAFGAAAEGLLRPGRAPGKWMLDLWAANRLDLERAGVREVAVAGECTACGVDRLFSHRRESGQAGRGAAIIVMRAMPHRSP